MRIKAGGAKLGLVWSGLAKAGTALAAKFSAAGAGVAGATAGAGGAALMTVGAAGAAAAGGAAIGHIIHREVTDPMMKADFARLESVDDLLAEIERVRKSESSTLAQKATALEVLKERMGTLKEGPSLASLIGLLNHASVL